MVLNLRPAKIGGRLKSWVLLPWRQPGAEPFLARSTLGAFPEPETGLRSLGGCTFAPRTPHQARPTFPMARHRPHHTCRVGAGHYWGGTTSWHDRDTKPTPLDPPQKLTSFATARQWSRWFESSSVSTAPTARCCGRQSRSRARAKPGRTAGAAIPLDDATGQVPDNLVAVDDRVSQYGGLGRVLRIIQ